MGDHSPCQTKDGIQFVRTAHTIHMHVVMLPSCKVRLHVSDSCMHASESACDMMQGTWTCRAPNITPNRAVIFHSHVVATCKWLDMAVEVPSSCLHEKDYRRHLYHAKKAMVLLEVAKHLGKSKLVVAQEWQLVNDDPRYISCLTDRESHASCWRCMFSCLVQSARQCQACQAALPLFSSMCK